MGIQLDRVINENYEKLNTVDQHILQFVQANLESCKKMNIADLARHCSVSTATILRTAQKLNFSGYSEFKYFLRSDSAENAEVLNLIEILNQDILKTDIDAIIREKNDGRPIKVVANLPYYITTPIIMDLLENERHVDSITVMVQKEVAERMQARPKEKEYGALSIAVQYYCDAKLDMIVQPACFMPRPKVASAVITLKVLPERKVKTADEKLFFHLVKCAFGQRRKTLMNCLFHLGNLGFSKEELAELLEELGWDTRVRGEALGLEEFAALTDKIAQKKQAYNQKLRNLI